MVAPQADHDSSIARLILLPSLITLGVTVLRLAGELQGWSKTWFNPEAGGGGAIVGITWLAPVFGIYFALRLSNAGEGPQSVKRAIALALLGVALAFAGTLPGAFLFSTLGFRGYLIYWGLLLLVAAAIQYPAWPRFFKVQAAYAFAARVPVVVVMFLAFRGNWGTHYDALPPVPLPDWGFWQKFVWLGLIPQLTLWLGVTIVFGAAFGTVAVAIARLLKPPPHAAT